MEKAMILSFVFTVGVPWPVKDAFQSAILRVNKISEQR